MGADGIGDVANIDGVQVLGGGGAGLFHKDLVVQVVAELGHEDMDAPCDFQHVQALGHVFWEGKGE